MKLFKADYESEKIIYNRHGAGFFSCCSVKLNNLVEVINSIRKLPNSVDSTQLFEKYKKKGKRGEDITFDYFEHYENIKDVNIIYPIDYKHNDQWKNYCNLDFKGITPIIKKYFSPSIKINTIVKNLQKKYNIVYNNTLSVYYRGTDKYIETPLASYDEFYEKILKIRDINININILVQSDSAQFIDYINSKNLERVIIIDENKISYTNKGIHNEHSSDKNYQDMFYFLSTIIIMSKCKYIICSSGNCAIWTMLYRGHNKNIIQYFKGTWYESV